MVSSEPSLIATVLGLSVMLVVAFDGQPLIVDSPGRHWFTALAVAAVLLGLCGFLIMERWDVLAAGMAIAYHVLLLRSLYRLFFLRIGRPPLATVYRSVVSGDGPDRLYTFLYFALGVLGFLLIGVGLKTLVN